MKVKKAAATSGRGSKGVVVDARKSSARKGRSNAASAAASTAASRSSSPTAARRNFVVFLSLVGLLSFTSILLLALSPAPLSPSAPASLFALDAPQSLDEIFRTSVPVDGGRWRHIFVHHSRTPGGSAATLARTGGMPSDHFVIGNGDGAIDGEIQITQRWAGQMTAAPVEGLDRINADCISICLVGDFEQGAPTPTQNLRLAQLVGTLQRRLQIGAGKVMLLEGSPAAAGTGRHFPAASFRAQLLP